MDFDAFKNVQTNTELAKKESRLNKDEDHEMNADEEASTQLSVEDMYKGMNFINCQFSNTIVRSMKMLTFENYSYIICSFSDGLILTMSLDHSKAC